MIEHITETWTWVQPKEFWNFFILPFVGLALTAFFGLITCFNKNRVRISLGDHYDSPEASPLGITIMVGLLTVIGFIYQIVGYVGADSEIDQETTTEYIVVEGTVSDSITTSSTFLNDSPSQVSIRIEEDPDVLITLSRDFDVAKFLNRSGIETGVLYCSVPKHEDSKALKCSSKIDESPVPLESTRTGVESRSEGYEVEHTVTRTPWGDTE